MFIRLLRLPYETRFIVSVPDEVWVTDAVALDGSHVALRFSDGHCGVLDMSPYMDDGVFSGCVTRMFSGRPEPV